MYSNIATVLTNMWQLRATSPIKLLSIENLSEIMHINLPLETSGGQ